MKSFYQNRDDIFFTKISINNNYPSHLHGHIEIIYVISGLIEVTIGEETKQLTKNHMAIVFPNVIHRYETPSESQIILLIFDANFVNDYSFELLKKRPNSAFVDNELISTELLPYIEELIASPPNTDSRIKKGFLYIILGNILTTLTLDKLQLPNDIDLNQQLLLYIDQHFTEDITLNSLAHQFGVSKFYISHIFSDKLKISFTTYLNALRIKKAQHLLLSTNDSVTEIAYNSGFTSLRTFFRIFQKVSMMTPKDFRNKHLT